MIKLNLSNDPLHRTLGKEVGAGLLDSGLFKAAVLAVAIVGDFYCLFNVFDMNSQTATALLLIESVILACVLDVTPSLIAGFCSRLLPTVRARKIALVVLIALLLAAFGLTFAMSYDLRWQSRDAMFTTDTGLSFTQTEQQTVQQGLTPGQESAARFLGFAPLLSSIMVFALFWEIDPAAKQRRALRQRLLMARRYVDTLDTRIALRQQDLATDLDELENRRLEAGRGYYHDVGELGRITARRVLAQRLGDAASAAALMELEIQLSADLANTRETLARSAA